MTGCVPGRRARACLMGWAGELTTVYPATGRLRQIGKHGAANDGARLDARLNTAAAAAPFRQRVFIAPNDANSHFECQMPAGIPPCTLVRMQCILPARGRS